MMSIYKDGPSCQLLEIPQGMTSGLCHLPPWMDTESREASRCTGHQCYLLPTTLHDWEDSTMWFCMLSRSPDSLSALAGWKRRNLCLCPSLSLSLPLSLSVSLSLSLSLSLSTVQRISEGGMVSSHLKASPSPSLRLTWGTSSYRQLLCI
jgi:hypothetical protein